MLNPHSGSCPTAGRYPPSDGGWAVDRTLAAPLAPGTNIIGAGCLPGLVPSLLGIPASELIIRSVPLGDVWGSVETALLTWLC